MAGWVKLIRYHLTRFFLTEKDRYMQKLFDFLKHIFSPGSSRTTPVPQQSREEIQAVFKKRYARFRSLLTANNNTLQAMAELEKAYYSGDSYRMALIRSRVITMLVNVYKMIGNLKEMSDGKYKELETVFDKISDDINDVIDQQPTRRQGPYIRSIAEINRADKDCVGEKMANLGEISTIPHIEIPPGFVLTTSATSHFLTVEIIAEINRLLQILEPDDLDSLFKTCQDIEETIMAATLPTDIEEELMLHYADLEKNSFPDCPVALRSSALGEDSEGLSFAGLYHSALHIERSSLAEAYKRVIASKYSAKAIMYRAKRGYRHEDIEMCVGCQVMIDAHISGVIYSRGPEESHSDSIRINVTAGLAKGVVDGTQPTDLYLVDRTPPHTLVRADIRRDDYSTAQTATSNSSLSTQQLRQLAETTLRIEKHFGKPQDIEWSFDRQGRLYILQCRPLAEVAATEVEVEEKPVIAVENNREKPFFLGGICAGSGGTIGPVFKVSSQKEMQRIPKGVIAVVEHPLPEWAPILSKSVGIIAEHGSEAGHLATVSREFGIPALFSVPGAMKSLTNGETLTLNASGHTIYRGSRPDQLSRLTAKKDIMAGSPVQRIMSETLRHITPLNLLDPESSYFKPSCCETLHDITRFCHEKSVSEMFNFGQKTQSNQMAAKRLVGKVPLEWWVIDLADGIRPEADAEAKAVHIEDIASQPMLAIWRGISAFPWEGPPPVSMRGFGSIIFQSAMRPELDPAVASKMTVKNYFLISGNFCNLSARLGYHYAMIEAYASDLLTENYVTFRFKGGAADLKRKAIRARLLADILEQYDFSIELKSDALLARIKKKPAAYLESRLMVLGYLTLHARQLDMVMEQAGAVARYKERFLLEIEQMLALQPEKPLQENGYANDQKNTAG
jgi:pyruvate,water dikinase